MTEEEITELAKELCGNHKKAAIKFMQLSEHDADAVMQAVESMQAVSVETRDDDRRARDKDL